MRVIKNSSFIGSKTIFPLPVVAYRTQRDRYNLAGPPLGRSVRSIIKFRIFVVSYPTFLCRGIFRIFIISYIKE